MELSTKPFLRYCRTRILTCHYILFFFSSSNPGNFSNSQVFFQKKIKKKLLALIQWSQSLCLKNLSVLSFQTLNFLVPPNFSEFWKKFFELCCSCWNSLPVSNGVFFEGSKKIQDVKRVKSELTSFPNSWKWLKKTFLPQKQKHKILVGGQVSLVFLWHFFCFLRKISCMNPHQLHWYFSLQSRKLPKSFRVEFEVSVNKLLKLLGGKEIVQETVIILEPKLDKGKCLKVYFGKQVGFDRFQKKYIFLSFFESVHIQDFFRVSKQCRQGMGCVPGYP